MISSKRNRYIFMI